MHEVLLVYKQIEMQFDEEGRMVFPSIETISPSFSVHNDSVHAIKHF